MIFVVLKSRAFGPFFILVLFFCAFQEFSTENSNSCQNVKLRADECYTNLKAEIEKYDINYYDKNIDRMSWMKKLATYCVKRLRNGELGKECTTIKKELTACQCADNCEQYTKLSDIRRDMEKVCSNGCLEVVNTMESLHACTKDMPINVIKDQLYNKFCTSWKQILKCTKDLSTQRKCNSDFIERFLLEQTSEQLVKGEYIWMQNIYNELCNMRCASSQMVLRETENCASLLRQVMSRPSGTYWFCKQLGKFMGCIQQPTREGCRSVFEIIQYVYPNLTKYTGMATDHCPLVLAQTTESTQSGSVRGVEENFDVSIPSVSGPLAAPEILNTTTLASGKLDNAPWKPCKVHSRQHSVAGRNPTQITLISILFYTTLYVSSAYL